MYKIPLSMSLLGLFLGLIILPTVGLADLNIYSHRQPFLISPFIEAYEKESGTKVNIVYASKGLAQRLQAEGELSPADVILTVDIARLSVYADKDLLAVVQSSLLENSIPPHLRDKDNKWFAFSKRARVIAVSKQSSDVNNIKDYEDLSNKEWEGRICSRPGSHVYNRALLASILHAHGYEKAKKWAKSLRDNFARRPQGNDRAQVKAIQEGICDIAIINHYYYGKLKFSEKVEHRSWADNVDIIFPNQGNRGTHINISGGGVAKYSKNKKEAVKFLEFLISDKAQELYASINFEYPVRTDVPLSEELASWGKFKEDKMPIGKIAVLAPEAQKIIDVIGW
ncbi:MAG: iron ABC transporter substrate-binding protein [Rhodospirillaceae bacterium]|nr:iron ABC transporter substrate-binding protein [Rhodospirillaceae bacterium]